MRTLLLLPLLTLCACGGSGGSPETAPAKDSSAAQPPVPRMPEQDSLSDGVHTYRDAEGRKMLEGEMHNRHRHGVWTSFGANGRVLSRSEYIDGELEGPTVVFRENGVLYYDGQYRHGHEVGDWRFYDEHGAQARTVHYDSTGAVINDR